MYPGVNQIIHPLIIVILSGIEVLRYLTGPKFLWYQIRFLQFSCFRIKSTLADFVSRSNMRLLLRVCHWPTEFRTWTITGKIYPNRMLLPSSLDHNQTRRLELQFAS
jgi:hypothetical protein